MAVKLTFFIPAGRGQARFQDDLLRKLSGISLIQRAIDKARELGGSGSSIHILTDSDEVALVGKRNDVSVFCKSPLSLENATKNSDLKRYIEIAECESEICAILSPYAPLLDLDVFRQATGHFIKTRACVLKPVRTISRRVFDQTNRANVNGLLSQQNEYHRLESISFALMVPGLLAQGDQVAVTVEAFEVDDSAFEIETLRDWWVCEKLLQRKRIIFHVIGNKRVGMGHVYRALSLAHELHDHDILFVTDTKNQVAVEAIVQRDYWLGVYSPDSVVDEIIRLQPDMVINDVLNTRKKDIERIRENFSLAVSFEDLGPGARRTDLTINELYDTARFHGRNVLWGRKYFFLREEFALARPHRFTRSASSIMLAFGGTDQHDLARKIVVAILPICRELGLAVHIVTGPGYRGYDRLMRLVQDESRISLTHDSQVISGLMEQVQVAITSNGRTVYEFAHMNIPAIVIAQHERELTHSFASLENGFIPLGLYDPGKTEKRVQQALRNLITNGSLRKTLHQRMSQHRFSENKERVLRQLNKLLMRKSRKRSVVQA